MSSGGTAIALLCKVFSCHGGACPQSVSAAHAWLAQQCRRRMAHGWFGLLRHTWVPEFLHGIRQLLAPRVRLSTETSAKCHRCASLASATRVAALCKVLGGRWRQGACDDESTASALGTSAGAGNPLPRNGHAHWPLSRLSRNTNRQPIVNAFCRHCGPCRRDDAGRHCLCLREPNGKLHCGDNGRAHARRGPWRPPGCSRAACASGRAGCGAA